jgi:hypothetical protein
MKSRYRITLDITLKNFGVTPLAHLHAILHNLLADGDHISGLTVVDAHDLSRESVPARRVVKECDILKDS